MSSTAPIIIDGDYLLSTRTADYAVPAGQDPVWFRLQGEPSNAYGAFVHYRDLPRESRSVLAAWRKTHPQAKTPSSRYSRWFQDYRWKERTQAYDFYLDTLRLRQREKNHLADIEEYRQRLQQSSRAAFNAAIKALNIATRRLDQVQQPGDLKLEQLPGWLRAISTVLEAATAGEAQALAVDKLLLLFEQQQQDETPDFEYTDGEAYR